MEDLPVFLHFHLCLSAHQVHNIGKPDYGGMLAVGGVKGIIYIKVDQGF